MTDNIITKTSKLLWKNWWDNYRYNGGLRAVWSCLRGTQRLQRGEFARIGPTHPQVDVVTFSVLPQLTALWATFMDQTIDARLMRVLIGDCSGSLQHHMYPGSSAILIPMLNYEHGEKLDIFLCRVCQAEYMVITDDDIFWLDKAPLQWALAQLESDPRIASVSLLPKKVSSNIIDDREHLFTGSCFVIRRQIWLDEKLSFKIDYSPYLKGYGWFYEIGEFAQVTLMERNYKIVVAPPEIQEHLVAFRGISHWTLKIRKTAGNLSVYFRADPQARSEKGLEAVYMARGLKKLIIKYYPQAKEPCLLPERFLQRAEATCLRVLSEEQANSMRANIEEKLARLNVRWF